MQAGTPLEIRLDGSAGASPGQSEFCVAAGGIHPSHYLQPGKSRKLVFLVEGSLAPEHARLLHPGAPVEVRLKKHNEAGHLAEEEK